MIKELDRVVLKTNIVEERLEAGDVGTVVHVHRNGEAFIIEFFTLEGDTYSVTTVPASQIRPVNKQDISHTRSRKLAV